MLAKRRRPGWTPVGIGGGEDSKTTTGRGKWRNVQNFLYIQDQRVRNLPYMVSDQQNGKMFFLTDFRPAGGFSGIQAGLSRVGGGWGDFLRFRSARGRPGAPAGSGFMILLPKSFQILAASSKAYRFYWFFYFLLNSSIFHDFSLRSRGEVSKNAPFSKVGHQLDRSRKYFFSPKDGASRRVFGNQIANERRT